MSFFETSGLAVGYNGKTLIRDIDLALERGGILTLIGPNGSGKSTILKTIARQLAAIRGVVAVEGRDIAAMSAKELARRQAVVLTDRIRPELATAREIVSLGRYPYTNAVGRMTPEDRRIVARSLELVNAADLAQRDYMTLSDGQKQRVILARALAQQPDLLVLDEPTAYLDVKHKAELLSLLRELAENEGLTVIMSLHEIDLAQKISDKIMCVSGETISNFGTPEEIFREEIINELYGISEGSFNIAFGSVELPPPAGEPDTFVISGCGSGISVFRRLQKEDTPFYAGVLAENDVDFQVAKVLAAEVVTEKPFEPIGEEAAARARALMDRCSRVIYAPFPLGTGSARILGLVEAAREAGKLEEIKK